MNRVFLTKKYRIMPGPVISKTDRQRHYVTASRLMQLFGVNPAECIVHDSYRAVPDDGLIKLYPRFNGDYDLAAIIAEQKVKTMSEASFQDFKHIGTRTKSSNRFYGGSGAWCVFIGFERRGYPVFIQRDKDDKQIMVHAGCRYKTLRQAMAHWGRRSRGSNGKEILQLIQIGLRTAVREGFIKPRFYPKYFSTKLTRP